jgi:L-seryl-tRNA(Ser) seleniumtransferase
MATASVDALRARTEAVVDRLPPDLARAVPCASVTGGGTLPGVEIPSVGLAVDGDHAAALRERSLPVVARVVEGVTVCDLRTVDPGDDAELVAALRELAPASG